MHQKTLSEYPAVYGGQVSGISRVSDFRITGAECPAGQRPATTLDKQFAGTRIRPTSGRAINGDGAGGALNDGRYFIGPRTVIECRSAVPVGVSKPVAAAALPRVRNSGRISSCGDHQQYHECNEIGFDSLHEISP